jgi:hypothetical protein
MEDQPICAKLIVIFAYLYSHSYLIFQRGFRRRDNAFVLDGFVSRQDEKIMRNRIYA